MKRLLVVLVVLAGLGYVGWRVYVKIGEARKSGGRRNRSQAIAVAVEPVRKQTIRDVAEFTGALLPKSRFVVAPKVPGRLEKLLVNIGDKLKNGELIAVLDSEEYAQLVVQAKAELEVCRANAGEARSALDLARREYERAESLRKTQVTSEAELDEAGARLRAGEAKYQVAQAQIRQREAALRGDEVRLSYTRILAAWDDKGSRQVAERFVDEGSMLKANEPIVSVVDTSVVIAVINVIERDFPQVRVGHPAIITTDAYEDREFKGRIVRVAPVLKEESRQARVEVEIPNADGLLAPGMFVRARIQFAEHKDVPVVPVSAVVRRGGRQGVFVADLKEKKGRFTPVRVGIREGDVAELLSPKIEGKVITLGHHLLEDGGAINLPGQESPGKDGEGRGATKEKR